MLVGVFSPLAKIFQPEFQVFVPWEAEERKAMAKEVGAKNVPKHKIERVTQADLLKDPARIHKEEKFTINIPRSIGDVNLVYGMPQYIRDLDLLHYLTGGDTGEHQQGTDPYGVAKVPMELDQVSILMAALMGQEGPETGLQDEAKNAVLQAKEISHTRVMRQIKRIFETLKHQRQLNKEQGKGDYLPSPVEFLCVYVLSAEETKNAEDLKGIQNNFSKMMDTIEA